MTTLINKLVLLNGFRKELGLVDLDTWKGTEGKLDKAIVEAQQALEARVKIKADAARQAEVDKLLAQLNKWLVPMGQKEVKEWHGSLDDLSKRIREARHAHRDMMDQEAKLAKQKNKPVTLPEVFGLAVKPTGKLKAKVAASKVKAAAKAKAKTRPTEVEKGLLPSIAAELGLNPKVARAKLRKQFGSAWRNLTEKELRKALA